MCSVPLWISQLVGFVPQGDPLGLLDLKERRLFRFEMRAKRNFSHVAKSIALQKGDRGYRKVRAERSPCYSLLWFGACCPAGDCGALGLLCKAASKLLDLPGYRALSQAPMFLLHSSSKRYSNSQK